MSEAIREPAQLQPEPGSGRPAARFKLDSLLDVAIWLGLILSIFAVYGQSRHFDFISCDDDLYVLRNSRVLAGLTPAGIQWAFTGVAAGNWIPVTLLSHMLDVQLFGLRSGMHHLVNVGLHALSAVLLFVVLRRATRARWPSAFVAFVFALHPLHVESVAWISERKDVLSAFFFFLTLYCYVRYTERPGVGRYLAVLGPFCLGLMSKPMLVTLPFTLLLFDIWPLRRVRLPKTVWEKLPLFALSAGASVATYWAQRATGSVDLAIPLDARIAKALISYVTYIRQTFWPAGLAVFYPYPRVILARRGGIALAIVLSVSALAILMWRGRPYLAPYFATGWFWYLGMLVPVIGLVQAGHQSHADRYTYLPMAGLSLMLAWGAADVVRKWPRTKPAIATAATAACMVCMALAWRQAAYWRNGETLYQHAIDVTGDNWFAHNNLGYYLKDKPGRRADAVEHFEAALRIKPDYAEANNNLGACLSDAGLCGAAIPHFEAALRAKPGTAEPSNNIAVCLAKSERYAAAIPYFEEALRVDPAYVNAHLNLARVLSKIPGRALEAIAQYTAVLRLSPDYMGVHRDLGDLLMSLGRTEEAIAHFEAAQRSSPDPEISKIIDRLRAGRR
jgi:tetratricopeptide (TPR) repeat protein